MSVNLQKGQKVSLSKEQPGLSKVVVGLGWDEATGLVNQNIDCDAFALLLTNGKIADKRDIVYYGNLNHVSGAVQHMGDNLTGAGDGDDEQIVVELSRIPAQYDRIIIAVNIYNASIKQQHFGMIDNAFIRLVDARSNREICIYNLSEKYSGSTAMLFGELSKVNGDWQFSAMGQGTNDKSVTEVASRYGLTAQKATSGGCYVATAVYGSYDCPQVWTLRRYRDNTLAKTWYGRAFIRVYYAISPTLVKWFGETNWFKMMWKGKLDRMVSRLQEQGVKDTPYQDRKW